MNELKFNHLKAFTTDNGKIVTMKALLTIHGEQFVEVNENSTRYKSTELTALFTWRKRNINIQLLNCAVTARAKA